ncbi:MAG TPA: hypothetical protein P5555_10955 [Candidatus Paceibacterota bacterium]|nr:hypothetical protein [Verrucomicrobiota bacterium]HRZ45697.1 hypothetical protein [Candidatus Paceibacterota bacterium]
MKIKSREHLLAIAAIGIVALLVGDRLVLTPLTSAWKARSARVVALQKSIQNGALLLDREQPIRERWSMMETNTLSADVSAAENSVLKAVDRWAQASRISFTSIKPQWKQSSPEFKTLECRADAFGNLSSVARFLHELETDPLALKIEEIEITSRDNEGQQLSLAVRFSGLLLTENNP